mgnify:CR=1 FL=1
MAWQLGAQLSGAGSTRFCLCVLQQLGAQLAGAGLNPPSPWLLPSCAQVHGAVLEALNAAAAPAKAELAAAALPAAKDGRPQQAGSPSLAAGLLLLATALLKAARLSLKRSSAIAARLPAVAAAAAAAGGDAVAAAAPAEDAAPLAATLQAAATAAADAVDAGKRQAAEASSKLALAEEEDSPPSLAAAQAAYSAVAALQQALAVEALAGVTSLRLQEGKPADGGAMAAAAAAAAANGSDAGGKKKDKKKDKGAAAGVLLGKGTAQLRSYLEHAAAGGDPSASGDAADGDLAASLRCLSLEGGGAAVQAGLAGVAAALDPEGHAVAQQLAALRAIIEANQVRVWFGVGW